jgi:hypothetical protein
MLQSKYRAAALAAAVGMSAAFVQPQVRGQETKPADTDMAQEVKALRAQVHELQDHQREMEAQLKAQKDAASQPSGAEVTAAVEKVQRDAQIHSQILETGGMAAGYDPNNGFFIRADDGRFVLHPWSLFQFRDVSTVREGADSGNNNNVQNGFELRRVQLGVDGTIFTPDFTYRVFIQNVRTTGDIELVMAMARYHFADTPWSVLGGQFKSPLDHEQLISDKYQLAVDRTLTDDVLAGGEAFSDGVSLVYEDHGPTRAQVAITNGFDVDNTSFQDYPTRPADFGVGGRAEFKVLGDWRDYDQFTSLNNHEQELLVFGAGADFTEAGRANAFRHVIDAQFNSGPLGLYAAYLGRYTQNNGTDGDTYDASLRLQVSYLITPQLEGFGRYDYLHLDSKTVAAGEHDSVNEFTAGFNYYFHGHAAKFVLDLSYLPQGSPENDTGSGVLENPKGELLGRAQFQLIL